MTHARDDEAAVPSTGRLPTLLSIGIALFLLSQIAIPLSYYLQDEATSERFAWRMFSSVDLSTWQTSVSAVMEENGQTIERDVPLKSMLQETHWKLVERAQLDVVQPLLQQLVDRPGVREVRYVAQGYFPSGAPMAPIRLVMKKGQTMERLRD